MKQRYAVALIFVLSALIFAGCRDMTNTTSTTKTPATSATTQSTVLPAPDITLPMDTTVPETTDFSTGAAARGPRY